MTFANATNAGPGSSPQRRAPASNSTSTPMLASCAAAARESSCAAASESSETSRRRARARRAKPPEFFLPHDGKRHQDVVEPGAGHHFRFPHFGDRQAYGAAAPTGGAKPPPSCAFSCAGVNPRLAGGTIPPPGGGSFPRRQDQPLAPEWKALWHSMNTSLHSPAPLADARDAVDFNFDFG